MDLADDIGLDSRKKPTDVYKALAREFCALLNGDITELSNRTKQVAPKGQQSTDENNQTKKSSCKLHESCVTVVILL